MSCLNSQLLRYSDIEKVRNLAQSAADYFGIEQKIYKSYCSGKIIFKFAPDWKGETVEVIRPTGQDTNKNIVRNSKHRQRTTIEPGESGTSE